MKKEWLKTVSALLAVSMTVSIVAACGRSGKEPADSLVASETYSEVTVSAMEEEALDDLVQEALGEDEKWDGDFSKLTTDQKTKVQNKLAEKGYAASVSDKGVAYYDYVPTADKEEIAEVAQSVLGEDKKWDGEYGSLTDDEKIAVRDELRERGYDVEAGEDSFDFYNAAGRQAETFKPSYELLPSKEQIAGAVADVIGTDAYLKWDRNMLSLTEEQRKDVLKALNHYGFDLALNEQGAFYIVHNPGQTVTFDTAYTSTSENGTTMAPTTEEQTEDTRPQKAAPTAERTALSAFGGTGGDTFRHVAACDDGGYIATAQFRSADGDYAGTDKSWQRTKSAVIKYDKDGAFRWKYTIGGSALNGYTGVQLDASAELRDGSVISVGSTDARTLGVKKDDASDALLVKTSKDGNHEWSKRFSGELEDIFASVAATPDGGFVVGGRSRSSTGDMAGTAYNTLKAILIKYSADGTQEWMRSFTSGSNAAVFNAIAVTDAGYIYADCYAAMALGSALQLDMTTYAGLGGADSIVFKFDPSGTLLTHCAIAGSGNDQVTSLALADGGVIVGGVCTKNVRKDSVFAGHHNYGGNDAFLIRLDASLNVEWVKTFGGIETDVITGVAKIRDGYAAVGWSQSTNNAFSFLGSGAADAFVLTVSENGTGVEKYALKGTKDDRALGVVANGSRRFAVVGTTISATNDFSGISPAPENLAVGFLGLYQVK